MYSTVRRLLTQALSAGQSSRDAARAALSASGLRSSIQGYVDQRSTHHVRGWVRDMSHDASRIAYEVVLDGAGGPLVLASGVADVLDPVLVELGVGDGSYGFIAHFDPPLSAPDRDRVRVRTLGGHELDLAPALSIRLPDAPVPRLVGYVDERSARHIAGWVWNEADPAERVEFDVVQTTAAGEQVVAHGVAHHWSAGLAKLGLGDAAYSFCVLFSSAVADPSQLSVRARADRFVLPLAPALKTDFQPISHVAMDIVNNCNLRCPFCTFDYANTRTTRFMAPETFKSALDLLPFVTEGNFWLSCLHEATMHPELLAFMDMVPQEYRDRLMYTTNLAKRMPDAYFTQLAQSGMHHLNISLESLSPPIYERLRKGARFPIFQENWTKLIDAVRAGPAPPRLRYNMMAYKSNRDELPALTDILLNDKLAWQVEIRHTFDEAHIPDSFRDSEYLDEADWDWLAARLAHHDPARVLLVRPPPPPAQAPAPVSGIPVPAAAVAPGPHPADERAAFPLGMRVEWDGTLMVYSETMGADGLPRHTNHVTTHVREMTNPMVLIAGLLG